MRWIAVDTSAIQSKSQSNAENIPADILDLEKEALKNEKIVNREFGENENIAWIKYTIENGEEFYYIGDKVERKHYKEVNTDGGISLEYNPDYKEEGENA